MCQECIKCIAIVRRKLSDRWEISESEILEFLISCTCFPLPNSNIEHRIDNLINKFGEEKTWNGFLGSSFMYAEKEFSKEIREVHNKYLIGVMTEALD